MITVRLHAPVYLFTKKYTFGDLRVLLCILRDHSIQYRKAVPDGRFSISFQTIHFHDDYYLKVFLELIKRQYKKVTLHYENAQFYLEVK